jgi:hypothetical protein
MSINVRWEVAPEWPETEGRVLGELRDDHSLVERFLVRSKVQDLANVRFIDPNGLTVFHQQHMRRLIDELETLSERQHDPDVQPHLRAVLDFVRQAYGRAKGSILFCGD